MKELLDRIDWEALKEQKRLLLDLIHEITKDVDDEEEAQPSLGHLDGLVHLIDHIQDLADKRGYPVAWLTEEKQP